MFGIGKLLGTGKRSTEASPVDIDRLRDQLDSLNARATLLLEELPDLLKAQSQDVETRLESLDRELAELHEVERSLLAAGDFRGIGAHLRMTANIGLLDTIASSIDFYYLGAAASEAERTASESGRAAALARGRWDRLATAKALAIRRRNEMPSVSRAEAIRRMQNEVVEVARQSGQSLTGSPDSVFNTIEGWLRKAGVP